MSKKKAVTKRNDFSTSEERLASLLQAVEYINKTYGDGALVRGSEAPPEFFIPQTIDTGILSLNAALGLSGIPRGKFTEIWGHNQVGKTSTTIWWIASAMKADPDFHAVFIDTEWRFDFLRAYEFGVDLSRLFLHQTTNGEEAIEIARTMLRAGIDLVVIDSVTGLLPTRQAEGDLNTSWVGLHARLMSEAARILTPSMAAYDRARRGAVVFTNQLRDNPGVMFGNPTGPTGGHALSFYASLRMELRSGAKDDWIVDPETGETIGQWVRFYPHKNSINGRKVDGKYPLLFVQGIDPYRDAIHAGELLGIIKRGGAWYSYTRPNGEEVRAQGETRFFQLLREQPEILDEIVNQCRNAIKPIFPPKKEEGTPQLTLVGDGLSA